MIEYYLYNQRTIKDNNTAKDSFHRQSNRYLNTAKIQQLQVGYHHFEGARHYLGSKPFISPLLVLANLSVYLLLTRSRYTGAAVETISIDERCRSCSTK